MPLMTGSPTPAPAAPIPTPPERPQPVPVPIPRPNDGLGDIFAALFGRPNPELEQMQGPGGKPALPGLGKPGLPGLGTGGGLPGLGGFNPFRKK